LTINPREIEAVCGGLVEQALHTKHRSTDIHADNEFRVEDAVISTLHERWNPPPDILPGFGLTFTGCRWK
jgi:hypothetical protein